MPPSADNPPMSSERIWHAAVALADRGGLESLTIRRLADELGVKPMTIYHYVPSKSAIVDGMVEAVFSEIDLPPSDLPWVEALRIRCCSARSVLNRHPWAAPLLESRMQPGPVNLAHHEAMVACLRRGGLSWDLVAHGYAALDSYVYGFAFQEATLPTIGDETFPEVAKEIASGFSPQAHPTLSAFTIEHVLQPGYSFGSSFEFGLNLILDGLVRAAPSS